MDAATTHSDRCKCGFVNIIIIIMIAVLVVGFIVFVVIHFAYEPYPAEFAVTDASLTENNFTTNNSSSTLRYDLDLNVTVRNSNKEYGICYDDIQVMAYYQKSQHMLGIENLTSFYQGKKNTTHLTLSLKLGQLRLDHVLCNHDGAISYHDIDVKIQVRKRFKAKYTWKGESYITCPLEVPLISYNSSDKGPQSANTSTSNFSTNRCYSFGEDFSGFPMDMDIAVSLGIFCVFVLSGCLYGRVARRHVSYI